MSIENWIYIGTINLDMSNDVHVMVWLMNWNPSVSRSTHSTGYEHVYILCVYLNIF